MSEPPGRLIASGRAADIYDLADGTVLRRYRTAHDGAPEAAAMGWLHDHGFPVPKVHRSDGSDLVMDRITGPTMLEDLEQRPWLVVSRIRTLVSLQRRLNELPAPGWFPRRDDIPAGDRVVHLDLHPMNVIMSPDGPVVIDWTNAAAGRASFDAATTYVLMATFETTGVRDRTTQRAVVELFRTLRGRSLVRASLTDACVTRLADANITDGERRAVNRLRDG